MGKDILTNFDRSRFQKLKLKFIQFKKLSLFISPRLRIIPKKSQNYLSPISTSCQTEYTLNLKYIVEFYSKSRGVGWVTRYEDPGYLDPTRITMGSLRIEGTAQNNWNLI